MDVSNNKFFLGFRRNQGQAPTAIKTSSRSGRASARQIKKHLANSKPKTLAKQYNSKQLLEIQNFLAKSATPLANRISDRMERIERFSSHLGPLSGLTKRVACSSMKAFSSDFKVYSAMKEAYSAVERAAIYAEACESLEALQQ